MSRTQFETAQEALHALEDAFRQEDLEQAVACKDFHAEARLLLQQVLPMLAEQQEIINQVAAELEALFRTTMQEEGFPDLQGIETQIVQIDPVPEYEGLYVATELQQLPDGTIGLLQVLMSQGEEGWKVLMPIGGEEGEDEEDGNQEGGLLLAFDPEEVLGRPLKNKRKEEEEDEA